MIDFNKLNLCKARLKREAKNKPQAYKIAFESCFHRVTMDEQTIRNSMVDSKYNPADGDASKITMVCPDCRDRKPGACDITPLKTVAMITPMYGRQIREMQQEEQQEQFQEK